MLFRSLDKANMDYETARLKLTEKQGELQEMLSKRVIDSRIQSIPKRVDAFVPREARSPKSHHDSKAGSAPREDSYVRTMHGPRDSYYSRADHSHTEDNRPRNYRNPKDIPCRNGASCARRNCIFSHPE